MCRSYFECFSVTAAAIYCFNPKLRLCFVWNWILLTLMKTRTAAHRSFVPHTTDSFFYVFPSAIWCKVNKLLMCYKYQLSKCCLEGILEGFTVSSSFLKMMKLIEDRIAKICHEFHRCRRWLHPDCS